MSSEITNALLAQKVSELLNSWRTRELQMREWMSGAADGGPYGDGRFPLSDYNGVVRYTYSPAALESGVASSAAASASTADASAASAASAAAAQAAAEAARNLSLTYRDSAQAARDVAIARRDEAANHAANALTLSNDAEASAIAASGSASDAQDSADAAAASDTSAGTHASNAAASAAAAAASALAAALFDPDNFYTKTAADARYRPLASAVPWADLSGVPSTFAPSAHLHAGYTIGSRATQSTSEVGLGILGGTGGIDWYLYQPTSYDELRLYNNSIGTMLTFSAAGTATAAKPWDFAAVGGSGALRLLGTTTASHFLYGTDEHIYLRPGKSTGSIYLGDASCAGVQIGYGSASAVAIGTNLAVNGGYTQSKSNTSHTATGVFDLTNPSASGQIPLNFIINGTLRGKVRSDYSGNLTLVANGGNIDFFLGGDAGTGTIVGRLGTIAMNFLGKQAFRFDDTWLRLNNAGEFSSGIYTPGALRADGGLSTLGGTISAGTGAVHGVGFYYAADTAFYLYNTAGFTYGSMRVGGARNGYAGLVIDSGSLQPTFMANGTQSGIYLQGTGRWTIYDDGGSPAGLRYYSTSSIYLSSGRASSTWWNFELSGAANYWFDKPVHVNGQVFKYGEGAHLYYASSSNASGKITVSTSTPSGTPANGDIWIQYTP